MRDFDSFDDFDLNIQSDEYDRDRATFEWGYSYEVDEQEPDMVDDLTDDDLTDYYSDDNYRDGGEDRHLDSWMEERYDLGDM